MTMSNVTHRHTHSRLKLSKCKTELITFLTKMGSSSVFLPSSCIPQLNNCPYHLNDTVRKPRSYLWPESFVDIVSANREAKVDFKPKVPDSKPTGFSLYIYLWIFTFVYLLR